MKKLCYTLLDPTGNRTALVHTRVPRAAHAAVGVALMRKEPSCEQVGFLSPGALSMAGGEFCGNASMCAAVCLWGEAMADGEEKAGALCVSGEEKAVAVRLRREKERFFATVAMPRVLSRGEERLPVGETERSFFVVTFAGITHVIVREPMEKQVALRVAGDWCRYLKAPALGVMLFDEKNDILTPLVYVPSSKTLVWEGSCASGTGAVGAYLSFTCGKPVCRTLHEPGGELRVLATADGDIELSGSVTIEKRGVLLWDDGAPLPE